MLIKKIGKFEIHFYEKEGTFEAYEVKKQKSLFSGKLEKALSSIGRPCKTIREAEGVIELHKFGTKVILVDRPFTPQINISELLKKKEMNSKEVMWLGRGGKKIQSFTHILVYTKELEKKFDSLIKEFEKLIGKWSDVIKEAESIQEGL